jgi:putative ABC transport system permease protein
VKADAVEGSKLAASVFTTVFLVLGLFSIAAGAMLIFTLFVMLAAERRPEMGIARAVGAQRTHLVQAFVAEGTLYDLLAGLFGVGLGVAASYGLVIAARNLVGESLSIMEPHMTARSLAISFCLGAILTFMTVVVSSLRISQLNIVAAVRGQTGGEARHEARQATRWRWVVVGVPALVVLPLGIYFVLRRGFGMPWAWIVGPGALIVGFATAVLGGLTQLAFPWTLGVSLVILGAAAFAQWYGATARLAWSSAGIALAAFWLLPNDLAERVFGEFEATGMEMFVLSGIMIVTGFTLLIVFNASLLTTVFGAQRRGPRRYAVPAMLAAGTAVALLAGLLFSSVGGGVGQLSFLLAAFLGTFAVLSLASIRIGRIAPAFKMGVAYPLANRFRTGMTISMFAIVVFSITMMGEINGSFLAMFTSDEGQGGWDVVAQTNRNNPLHDVPAALAEAGHDPSNIAASGQVTGFDDNVQEVRTVGGEWKSYPILSGDAAFFESAQMRLDARADGYANDADVYEAVAGTPRLAILDSAPLQVGGFVDPLAFRIDIDTSDGTFEPFQIETRDKVTGRTQLVTVIGFLSAKIPSNLFMGVYTNETTYRDVLGDPLYQVTYIRLVGSADPVAEAKSIESALVTLGVQAVSIEEEIDEVVSMSLGYLRVFQAFMALGLLVGIAALGVIALRSVVERRQQIGMLRAIGYQRGTVSLSFLLESGFIAMMGSFAGVVGATLLSWRLIQGGEFGGTTGLEFFIPWTEIILQVSLAFVFALLMTWWPSRQAAKVPIAEALRYE